jgi:ribosomal 50S subunit-recycling heat shock protein
MERLRIDKWLWAARFYKTRSLAARKSTRAGSRSTARSAKPAREVKVGDTVACGARARDAHRRRQGRLEHARPGAGGAAAVRGNGREPEGRARRRRAAPPGARAGRCPSSMAARPSAGGATSTRQPPGLGRPLERVDAAAASHARHAPYCRPPRPPWRRGRPACPTPAASGPAAGARRACRPAACRGRRCGRARAPGPASVRGTTGRRRPGPGPAGVTHRPGRRAARNPRRQPGPCRRGCRRCGRGSRS